MVSLASSVVSELESSDVGDRSLSKYGDLNANTQLFEQSSQMNHRINLVFCTRPNIVSSVSSVVTESEPSDVGDRPLPKYGDLNANT